MGGLHEDYGPNRISVETRRESFIIHAGYGAVPASRTVGELMPGTDITYDDSSGAGPRSWRVRARFEDFVLIAEQVSSKERELSLATRVLVPGMDDDFNEEAPLAKFWSEVPHPELMLEDVEHLIRALCHVPGCPSGVRKVMGVNEDGD